MMSSLRMKLSVQMTEDVVQMTDDIVQMTDDVVQMMDASLRII